MKFTSTLTLTGMVFAVLNQNVAMAANCRAKAELVKKGYNQHESIAILKGGKVISSTSNVNPCQVSKDIKSPLTFLFVWGASCEGYKFKECHGAYSKQTHLKGKVTNVQKVNETQSTCTIDFLC